MDEENIKILNDHLRKTSFLMDDIFREIDWIRRDIRFMLILLAVLAPVNLTAIIMFFINMYNQWA